MSKDEFVLVTGASGYIASHLVKQLLEQGYKVRGTVRSLKDEKKVSHLRKLVENPKYPLELCEANLLEEECWLKAVEGCTVVMHTASPFPDSIPDDESVLVKPAVNGTLFVIRACVQPNSKVKKVVLTSSVAAIFSDKLINGKLYSEKDWSDPDKVQPYYKSKTLAEKAAWDFVEDRKKNGLSCFELAVINPGFVLGPLLHNSECTSSNIIRKFMQKELPMIPSVSFTTCDVRDVALAHIRAMQIPEASNNRHLIGSTVDATTFLEIALILDAEFRPKGYKVPTTLAPNCLIKMLSIFDKSIRLVTPNLGIKYKSDNSRFINVLKIEPINLKKTLIDMGYSLIEKGMVTKK